MRFYWVVFVLFSCSLSAQDFSDFPRAQAVVDSLVEEHGMDREQLEKWMAQGTYRESSVTKLAAPAETTKTYSEYKPMFVSKKTINGGLSFMDQHQVLLEKAEKEYGVPIPIIVAIIGIESRYGKSAGRHNTFDSLGSLAVTEGRRADYFQREWLRFLLIAHEQNFNPVKLKGSYAGASGYPQFMPTSYQAYAVDHDDDGDIDIWNDANDAIGSVANYLKQNGWQAGQLIVSAVSVSGDYEKIKVNSFERDRKLADAIDLGWQPKELQKDDSWVFPIRLDGENGPEFWLGYKNFWVISRYNRSTAYSMAVFQLAQAINNHD